MPSTVISLFLAHRSLALGPKRARYALAALPSGSCPTKGKFKEHLSLGCRNFIQPRGFLFKDTRGSFMCTLASWTHIYNYKYELISIHFYKDKCIQLHRHMKRMMRTIMSHVSYISSKTPLFFTPLQIIAAINVSRNISLLFLVSTSYANPPHLHVSYLMCSIHINLYWNTLFHDTTGTNGDVRVERHVKRCFDILNVVEPIETTNFVRTIVGAITSPHATVVHHVV